MGKKLELLVIHCTATPEGREVTSEEIRRWHTAPPPAGRGWNQVGYSDIIHLDGTIENLVEFDNDSEVDLWEITNGAAGFNGIARHIVYAGGTTKKGAAYDTRTPKQKEAIMTYIQYMIFRYPDIKIAGHTDLDPKKACPSFNVSRFCLANGIPAKNLYKS
ncbi:MAG: N-acetylmuramoyl-L-alanine amidase [Bacteroidota bacterium]